MMPFKVYQPTFSADLLAQGEDAADFLQSQFSNELRPFAAGRCSYGLWLDVKGKVQADAYVLQTGEESFRILSEHSQGEALRTHLERHIVADDVEIEALVAPSHALTLIGESAQAWISAQGWPLPEANQFGEGEGVFVLQGRRSPEPSYELYFTESGVFHSAQKLLEQTGVEMATDEWIEDQRMQLGVPRVPQELGPEDLPGEASMVGAGVSLQKGCFLGQEVVARMHNVGRPRRGLYRVQGIGQPPEVLTSIETKEGSVAGTLRSAYTMGSHWQGVAMLKLHRIEENAALLLNGDSVELLLPLRTI